MYWGEIGPNIWGRFAALLGRMLASVFSPHAFRAEIYVDDPLMATAGTQAQRDSTFTIALLVLQTSGFPLAWGKGILGKPVTWTGAQLTSLPTSIMVSIPEDKLVILLNQTRELRASVVASRRTVRSYCGRLSFIGGMVPFIRPFLGMVWAALASSSSSRGFGKSKLPTNLIHCRQFRVALDWLLALLQGRHGPLVRTFPLQVITADEGDYIATDACHGALQESYIDAIFLCRGMPHPSRNWTFDGSVPRGVTQGITPHGKRSLCLWQSDCGYPPALCWPGPV